jgi:hypothetical protein
LHKTKEEDENNKNKGEKQRKIAYGWKNRRKNKREK